MIEPWHLIAAVITIVLSFWGLLTRERYSQHEYTNRLYDQHRDDIKDLTKKVDAEIKDINRKLDVASKDRRRLSERLVAVQSDAVEEEWRDD